MDWPALPFGAWRDTRETLHRCLQIVGKVQLALTPRTNHFWNVAFQPTARGLVTPPISHGDGTFVVDMDFVDHALVIRTDRGARRSLGFVSRPVADFYRDVRLLLRSLGIEPVIWDHPVEIAVEPVPFHADRRHASYDPEAVERWWKVVSQSARMLELFRARYVGKCSPVQFYWGSFDLAVSRYSGRRAPARPGLDEVQREAYSHEVSSVGFWPGDVRYPAAAYFAYTAPKPPGLEAEPVRPADAFWHEGLGEFLLPYEAMRSAPSPGDALLEFCESTYEAGADLGAWPREELERGAEGASIASSGPRDAPATQPLP